MLLFDQMRRRAARYVARAPMPLNLDRGVLSISFDDFPATAWTEAGPILRAHGVQATYYVCGGLEGQGNHFRGCDLEEIHDAGHEIGCHTFSHVSALRLSPAELAQDLDANARWTADRLDGHRMATFAWPFGDATAAGKPVIRKRFAGARGVRDGVNHGTVDGMLLKSIGLERRRLPDYDLDALLAEAAHRRGWLTAYGHDVQDRPTEYGCTPYDLDTLLLRARSAGLLIAPIGQVIRTGQCGDPVKSDGDLTDAGVVAEVSPNRA